MPELEVATLAETQSNKWQKLVALSYKNGGQGVVIFYGIAKPVRAPQIGSAKPYE